MSWQDDMRANPLQHVHVLRWAETGKGRVTSARVMHTAQISVDMTYTVFDPAQGRHIETEDPMAEVARIIEGRIEREEIKRIYNGDHDV